MSKKVTAEAMAVKADRNTLYKEEIARAYTLVMNMLNETFARHKDKRDIKFDIANEFMCQAILNKCEDSAFVDTLIKLESPGYLYRALQVFINRGSYLKGTRDRNSGKVLYTQYEVTADIQQLFKEQAKDMSEAIRLERQVINIKSKPYFHRIKVAMELMAYAGAGKITDIAILCNVELHRLKEITLSRPCYA
jgi:hypothetical protein